MGQRMKRWWAQRSIPTTAGELKNYFQDFELLSYADGYSLDLAHGESHHHGWASILAKKPR
jgi:hypothetical protein